LLFSDYLAIVSIWNCKSINVWVETKSKEGCAPNIYDGQFLCYNNQNMQWHHGPNTMLFSDGQFPWISRLVFIAKQINRPFDYCFLRWSGNIKPLSECNWTLGRHNSIYIFCRYINWEKRFRRRLALQLSKWNPRYYLWSESRPIIH